MSLTLKLLLGFGAFLVTVLTPAVAAWFDSPGLPMISLLSAGVSVTLVGVLLHTALQARTREMAERKQREAELRDAEIQSRALLEGAPVCNKVIDLDYRLQYMSSAGVEALKIEDIASFYGSQFPPDFYPEPYRAQLIRQLKAAMDGERSEMECPVLNMDGAELWYQTTFVPAPDVDGQVQYVLVSSVEITDRRRIEEDLKQAKERAEAASRAKSEFLANMSHEIRTPMTAILGFTETMLDPSLSEPDRFSAAHTVRRNGQHLLGILNDILDISKIEAGRLQVEHVRCSPVDVVADVKALMQVRADAKNLDLRVEFEGSIPESIESDPMRMRQILVNLVGNAIKFTETGEVRLVTRLLEDPANEEPALQFEVVDTGLGMTPEQVSRLFQAFSQADTSTSRKFGGTGLGLVISKRLAEMLGGDITVESTSEHGSVFRATLSIGSLDGVRMLKDAATATVTRPEDSTAVPLETGRIDGHVLLAEDGPDNQRLISFLLKKAGADVTIAENGQIALDLALTAKNEGHPFDVILMDIQMPVMDGYEATGQLRRQGYTGPIIALTAHAMAGDRQRCLDAGCDDFETKPVDRCSLIEKIRRYGTRDLEGQPCLEETPA